MTPLPNPDQFHVNSALGWLMLENLTEAAREFRNISHACAHHPDYLEIRCRLLMALKEWRAGLKISERQLEIAPERPQGWINRAYCLHELKRTREALATLLPAAERFPSHELIAFNLACYCCHLQKFSDALKWVNQTIGLVKARPA